MILESYTYLWILRYIFKILLRIWSFSKVKLVGSLLRSMISLDIWQGFKYQNDTHDISTVWLRKQDLNNGIIN